MSLLLNLTSVEISPLTRRNVHVFSHPRTASNLLCHLLSNQPGWTEAKYHFAAAFDLTRKSLDEGRLGDIGPEQYQQLTKMMSDGLEDLYRDCNRALDERKCLLVKNHVAHIWQRPRLWQNIWGEERGNVADHYLRDDPSTHSTNPTVIPDELLKSWLPIILIRHPALVFESWYRAETRVRPINLLDKSWELYITFRYTRQLYDWFVSKTADDSTDAIIIDADDIVQDDATMKKLCRLCGMDPSLVRSEWGALNTGEILSSRHLSYMTGFWNSASVDRSKTAKGIDMEAKRDQWKDEFGASEAERLYTLVEMALPDYYYLQSKRLR